MYNVYVNTFRRLNIPEGWESSTPLLSGFIKKPQNGFPLCEFQSRLITFHEQKSMQGKVADTIDDAGHEQDVSSGCMKLSLNCPLSLERMSCPVKGVGCSHVRCFDAKVRTHSFFILYHFNYSLVLVISRSSCCRRLPSGTV
jgi:hypothetical protein